MAKFLNKPKTFVKRTGGSSIVEIKEEVAGQKESKTEDENQEQKIQALEVAAETQAALKNDTQAAAEAEQEKEAAESKLSNATNPVAQAAAKVELKKAEDKVIRAKVKEA